MTATNDVLLVAQQIKRTSLAAEREHPATMGTNDNHTYPAPSHAVNTMS